MHTEFIEYADGDVTCEGYLAYDTAIKGRRPGILVCHAWGGQDDFARSKAEALAELGYLGFAIDMYGKGKRGSNPEENAKLMQPFMDDRAMLARRITAALEAVKSHFMADPENLGAIGFCFGGLCALDLARADPRGLKAVVSFHGLLSSDKSRGARQRKSAREFSPCMALMIRWPRRIRPWRSPGK